MVGCACCLPTIVFVLIFVSFAIFHVSNFSAKWFLKDYSLLRRSLSVLSNIASLVVALFAIFLGSLHSNSTLRARFFASLCVSMTKNDNLNAHRCSMLSNLSGQVLELGPGPGTNYKCWTNSTIKNWVGVEPNTFFNDELELEKLKRNITFPTKVVWTNGENLDITPGTFDHVVATHVLCSVNNVNEVFKQITRALKPGGTYHFIEHTLDSESTMNRYMQYLFSPIFSIVGNGCEFKQIWEELTGYPDFDVTFTHFRADIPIPFMRPHIKGIAINKKK